MTAIIQFPGSGPAHRLLSGKTATEEQRDAAHKLLADCAAYQADLTMAEPGTRALTSRELAAIGAYDLAYPRKADRFPPLAPAEQPGMTGMTGMTGGEIAGYAVAVVGAFWCGLAVIVVGQLMGWW